MLVPDQQSIVVVNDSRPALEVVADALEGAGYAVVGCTETNRSHAAVRAAMPNLVLIDTRGADASTWHSPAMLKLDAKTSSIPVLMCIADAPEQLAFAARGRAIGCSILVEPFETDDLLSRVHDLLA